MITLRGKLKKDADNAKSKDLSKRASVRDKLLVKEVNKLLIHYENIRSNLRCYVNDIYYFYYYYI